MNLADSLHLFARSDEALAVMQEGVEALGDRDMRATAWLRMQLSEILFDRGDWEAAERALPPLKRGSVGTTLLNLRLRRAEICSGTATWALHATSSKPPTALRAARPSRSSSASSAACARSWSCARGTSRPRAPPSTTRSTRSSSAPRTCRASPSSRSTAS